MKRWHYGINSYYKTADVYLEEASFLIFLLEDIVAFICELIPCIPLPKIKIKLKNPEDIEINDGNRWTTLKDWHGNLNALFHLYIHMPVDHFCWKRTKTKCISIPYDKCKELFYKEDKDFWDEEIKTAKEMQNENKKE